MMMVLTLLQVMPLSVVDALADVLFSQSSSEIMPLGLGDGSYSITFKTFNGTTILGPIMGVGGDCTSLAPTVPARTPSEYDYFNGVFGFVPTANAIKWVGDNGIPIDNVTGTETFRPIYDITLKQNNIRHPKKTFSAVYYDELYDSYSLTEYCYTTREYLDIGQKHQHLVEFAISDADIQKGILGGSTGTSYTVADGNPMVSQANRDGITVTLADYPIKQRYYIDGWEAADPATGLGPRQYPDIITSCYLFYAIFVPQIEIVIEAKSETYTYDGAEKTAAGYVIKDKNGTVLNLTMPNLTDPPNPRLPDTKGTNVGIYPHDFTVTLNTIDTQMRNPNSTQYRIYENGVDVTRKYWVSAIIPGELEITKRNATISVVPEQIPYDGEIHYPKFSATNMVAADLALIPQNSVDMKGIVYKKSNGAYGREVFVGVYRMEINDAMLRSYLGALYDNYNFTFNEGDFEIVTRDGPGGGGKYNVWLKANNDVDKPFTGYQQYANQVGAIVVDAVTGIANPKVFVYYGDRSTPVPTEGKGTHVDTYNIKILDSVNLSSDIKIWMEDPLNPGTWVDVTNEYNVSGKAPGEFKITERVIPMAVELPTKTEVYDASQKTFTIDNSTPGITVISVSGQLLGNITDGLTYTITLDSTVNGTDVGLYYHDGALPATGSRTGITNVKIMGTDVNGRTEDVTRLFLGQITWLEGYLNIVQGENRTLTIQPPPVERYYTGGDLPTEDSFTLVLTAQEAMNSPWIQTSFSGPETPASYMYDGHTLHITYHVVKKERLPGVYDDYVVIDSVEIHNAVGTVVNDITAINGEKIYNIITGTNDLIIYHRDEAPAHIGGPQPPLPLYLQVGDAPNAIFNAKEQTGYTSTVTIVPPTISGSMTAVLTLGVPTNAGMGVGTWIGTYPVNLTTAGRNGLVLYDGGKEMHLDKTGLGSGDYYIADEKPGTFEIKSNVGQSGTKPTLTITPGDVTKPYTGQWVNTDQTELAPSKPTLSSSDSTIKIPADSEWTSMGFTASGKGITPSATVPYDVNVDTVGQILVPTYVMGVPTGTAVDYAQEYTVTSGVGKLWIRDRSGTGTEAKLPLIVTGGEITYTFDGKIKTVTETTPGFTIDVTWPTMDFKGAEDRRVDDLTALGQGCAPTTPTTPYQVTITTSGFQVWHDGVNVTNNFTITQVNHGKLFILPPASLLPITLTSPDQTRPYTGDLVYGRWSEAGLPGDLDDSGDINKTIITATEAGGLPESGSITATAEAVGHTPNTTTGHQSVLTSIVITTFEGTDVTQYYDVDAYKAINTVPAGTLGKLFIRHRQPTDVPAKPGDPNGFIPIDVYLTGKSAYYTGDQIDVNDPLTNDANTGVAFDQIPVVDHLGNALNGETVKNITSSGSGIVPDAYTITMNPNGEVWILDKLTGVEVNVTDSYTLVDKGGTLTILTLPAGKKIKITFEAVPGVGYYNAGNPVTVTESPNGGTQVPNAGDSSILHDLAAKGFVYTMSASGAASNLGTTDHLMLIDLSTIVIKLSGSAINVKDNYEIELLDNSITLKPEPKPITLKTTPVDVYFDGTQFTVTQTIGNGIVVEDLQNALPAGCTIVFDDGTTAGAPITATASGVLPNGTGVDIGWDITQYQGVGYIVFDANGNDVTEAYIISTDFAPLTIKPRTIAENNLIPLTLQAGDDIDNVVFNNQTQYADETTAAVTETTGYFNNPNVVVQFSARPDGSGLLAAPTEYPIYVKDAKVFWIDPDTQIEHDVTQYYDITPLEGTFRIRAPGAGDTKPTIILTGQYIELPYTGTLVIATTGVDTNVTNVTTDATTLGSGVASGQDYPLPIQDAPVPFKLIVEDTANGLTSDLGRDWFDIIELNPGTLRILELDGSPGLEKIILSFYPDDATHPFNGQLIPIDLEYGVPYANAAYPNFAGLQVYEANGYAFDTQYVREVKADAHGEGFTPDIYPITIDKDQVSIMVGSGSDGMGMPVEMRQNYEINVAPSNLEITPPIASIPITLKAPSYTDAYTGDPIDASTQIDHSTGQRVFVTSGSLPYGSTENDVQFSAHTTVLPNGEYPTDYGTYTDNIVLDLSSIEIWGRHSVTGAMVDLTSFYNIDILPNDLTIMKVDLKLQITVSDILRAYTGQPVANVSPSEVTLSAVLTQGPASAWKSPRYQIVYNTLSYDRNIIIPGVYQNWITIPLTAGNLRIIDTQKNNLDITDRFDITVIPGKLTIHERDGSAQYPKLPLTLKPKDGTLPFTGLIQTYTTTEGDIVAGGANVPTGALIVSHAKGEALTVGKHDEVVEFDQPVKLNYTERGTTADLISNYEVTLKKANLTITPPTTLVSMIMTAGNKSVPFRPHGYYGDLPESRVGVTATFGNGKPILANYDVTGTIAYGEGTDPAAKNTTKVVKPLVMIDGIDHTQYFNIERRTGIFTIVPGQNIEIRVWPENQTVGYNARDQVIPSGFAKAELVNGEPLPNMRITVNATGKGNLPGKYDININTKGAGYDVKIEQLVDGKYVDLTAQYKVLPMKAILEITRVSIPIDVNVEKQPELTYNKTSQGTYQTFANTGVTGYVGEYTVGGGFAPLNLIVQIEGTIEGVNAGTYGIPANGKVKIFGYVNGVLTDITEFFTIRSHDGEMIINPYVLSGTYKAPNPDPERYTYGDDIIIPPPDYTLNTIDYFPGDEPPICIDWIIKLVGDQPLDAGAHYFWPEIISTDPNYDSSKLIPLPSDIPFIIGKAILTVMPIDSERAQRDPNPVLDYLATGMKYNQSVEQTGLDLSLVTWQAEEGEQVPIGTWVPVLNVQGPGEVRNYEIEYLNNNDPGHGIHVYGQVYVYGNYLTGYSPIYIRPEKYFSPGDATVVGAPEDNGLELRDYRRFDGWTLGLDGPWYEEGQLIGDYTLDLYAQWTQLYKMTIRHIRTDNRAEIAPAEILWLEEGALHAFVPVELEGFTPVSAVYTYGAEEYVTAPNGLMIMPTEEVEAYIEYSPPKEIEEIELVEEEKDDQDLNGQYVFGIFDQFVPTASIGSRNMGICFE